MRWYFAIDEAGGLHRAGDYAKLAVHSARAHGGLEPRLLYYGKPTTFTEWMTRQGVQIIDTVPSFIGTINKAEAAGTYKAHSIGHWLRCAVPLVEQEQDFVLYTDCDVIFLRAHNWQAIRPRLFAAAPEFKLDNWNYFNAGVMVLNVAAMRKTYALMEAHIISRIGAENGYAYDDEVALNEVYRGLWDKLDPACNWKPYWGYNARAALLHFHGPKLDTAEGIAGGGWPRNNPTSLQLGKMLDAYAGGYQDWSNALGDALQTIDLPMALRFSRLASALLRYRAGLAPVTDTSFMDFKLFPE